MDASDPWHSKITFSELKYIRKILINIYLMTWFLISGICLTDGLYIPVDQRTFYRNDSQKEDGKALIKEYEYNLLALLIITP